MARAAERLPDNVPGEFYVDRTTIERWLNHYQGQQTRKKTARPPPP